MKIILMIYVSGKDKWQINVEMNEQEGQSNFLVNP